MPCKMPSMRKGCQHDLQKRQKGGKRIVAGVVDPRRYWYCVVLLSLIAHSQGAATALAGRLLHLNGMPQGAQAAPEGGAQHPLQGVLTNTL
jgi:hypothetical protein